MNRRSVTSSFSLDWHSSASNPFPVHYKGILLDCAFRADIIVENQIILELKAVDRVTPIHEATLLTYMKLTNIRRTLLINFNVLLVKDGIQRFVL